MWSSTVAQTATGLLERQPIGRSLEGDQRRLARQPVVPFFWPCHRAQDLNSLTRMEPIPPALEAQSLNHWTARKVPIIYSKYSHVYMLISVFETWKGFRNYGQSCQFCLDAPPLVCIYSSFLSYPADIPCSSEYKLRRSCSKGMSY